LKEIHCSVCQADAAALHITGYFGVKAVKFFTLWRLEIKSETADYRIREQSPRTQYQCNFNFSFSNRYFPNLTRLKKGAATPASLRQRASEVRGSDGRVR
jgi:hypothetical protein